MAPPAYGTVSDSRSWGLNGMEGFSHSSGYQPHSNDFRRMAPGFGLDAVMNGGADGAGGADYFSSVAGPGDLTAWVDSMLGEVAADPLLPQIRDSWAADQLYPPLQSAQAAAARQTEEASSIQLVHLLQSCGNAVQNGDAAQASSLIDEMRAILSTVNTSYGINKVAGYFVDALHRRLYNPNFAVTANSSAEYSILYNHYYEACPYLKFAQFTANQAILEAFVGHDRVHIVDFSLMNGGQWPALIQALALRSGGPPFLRITGIGPPSHDGRDHLREVGLKLADIARSVHLRFAFRGVAANRLDDVKPWMLQVVPDEALAVNSLFQLHRLLSNPSASSVTTPIDSVLGWAAALKAKIVTVVEQETDHNKPEFIDRFNQALYYYSTMFDTLESGRGAVAPQSAALAELYLQRELTNVVCCEGVARVERHETLEQWRMRLGRAGLRQDRLGANALRQATSLIAMFPAAGYHVEEVDGALILGWHNHPLVSASAWTAAGQGGGRGVSPAESGVVRVCNSGSSSSNSGQ